MTAFQRNKAVKSDVIEAALPLNQIEKVLDEQLELGENGTVLAVDMVIRQAIYHGASDMHFEPWRDCLSLRFRLDGMLHEVALISKQHQERVTARIKVLANLVIYQKEIPQDGRIEASKERLGRALRASTFPTIYGEKTVIRILDPQQDLLRPEGLGFSDEVVENLRNLVLRPQGTLLLTGPSSSGKTTTIYSLLRELMESYSESRHIVTIEDPVEYQLGRVGQTQINPQLGLTFETAFRSLLRQDPDVIMVGEIRDADTARTATQAGLTGHFVISTIHSGTAAGVFTRLLDMGVEPFLAASSVTGVLAQRLARSTCVHCSRAYKPDAALLELYHVSTKGTKLRRGKGCEECNGIGFRGRSALGELLIVDEAIADLVLTRARTNVLHQAAIEGGMKTLLESGLEKVEDGIIPIEELRFVISPPDEKEVAALAKSRNRAKSRSNAKPRGTAASEDKAKAKKASRGSSASKIVAKKGVEKPKTTRPHR